MESRILPPYGTPIREAISRGDLSEMVELYRSVVPAIDELKMAIDKLQAAGATSNKPYGPPIYSAVARGDLQEMKSLRDSVKPALEQLEAAIRKLES